MADNCPRWAAPGSHRPGLGQALACHRAGLLLMRPCGAPLSARWPTSAGPDLPSDIHTPRIAGSIMVIAEAWVKFIHQLSITAFGQTPALVRVSGSCLRATSLPNVLAGGAVRCGGDAAR